MSQLFLVKTLVVLRSKNLSPPPWKPAGPRWRASSSTPENASRCWEKSVGGMGDLDGENSEKMIDLDGECWDFLMNRIFQGQSEMLMGKSEKCWRLYSLYGKIWSIVIGDAENISPIWKSKSAIFPGFETLQAPEFRKISLSRSDTLHLVSLSMSASESWGNHEILRWMEVILHHLKDGWNMLKPYKSWDVYHLSTGASDFAGPSTVSFKVVDGSWAKKITQGTMMHLLSPSQLIIAHRECFQDSKDWLILVI